MARVARRMPRINGTTSFVQELDSGKNSQVARQGARRLEGITQPSKSPQRNRVNATCGRIGLRRRSSENVLKVKRSSDAEDGHGGVRDDRT